MGFFTDLINYLSKNSQANRGGTVPPGSKQQPQVKDDKKSSAVCNSCEKSLRKGDAIYQCGECYNVYCQSCGYMYTDPKTGQLICMICKGPLNYTYLTW